MLQPQFQINLKHLKESLPRGNSFFTLFLYLSPSKSEHSENLIKFFQGYNLKMERVQSKKYSTNYMINNANFIAQSHHAVSLIEFQALVESLPLNIIVVAIFYQNQIWNFSRLQKLRTNSSSTLLLTDKVPFFLKPSKFFWRTLQRIQF